MRIRFYSVLVLSVLMLATPTLMLRGTLQRNTTSEIDGLSRLASLETVSLGTTIWTEQFENASEWTLASASAAILHLGDSLTLSISFQSKSTAQVVSVSRGVDLPLSQQPIVLTTLAVSKGVSYGIRFWGVTGTNKSFTAWHEGSALQHIQGFGSKRNLLANLVAEASNVNPDVDLSASRITRMQFYVEATPFTSGTFSMTISDIRAKSVSVTKVDSKHVDGNFTTLIADLGPTILTPGLFQVFIGLDVKGSPDLTYVLYFIPGTKVTAQGYTYATKAATTYELALLNPTLVNTSPMFTGNVHSTSVVLSAISGIITFFRLDSVSIRFLQAPAATGSPDPTNSREYAYYYFLFLFVIPIATTLLLVKVFRLE